MASERHGVEEDGEPSTAARYVCQDSFNVMKKVVSHMTARGELRALGPLHTQLIAAPAQNAPPLADTAATHSASAGTAPQEEVNPLLAF